MIPKNNDMRFEVTTSCNYNCIICPRDKLTRKIETMSIDLFKKLFDKINSETNQYSTLTFPGMGEPLLDKNLIKKINYAKKKKKNLDVLILSNGSLLTPDKFKEFENSGVSSIRISLYGNTSESYEAIHRCKSKNLFYKIRDNLLKISHLKKTTKLLLTLNVVNGINDSIVNDWISFWGKKVDLIEVWHPHNWVNSKSYRKIQRNKIRTCSRPFIGPLQVQVDGTINMCCFDFNGALTIGDLKTQSLSEIFSTPIYMKIKNCHQNGNFRRSGLICDKCDQRNADKSEIMLYDSKFNIKERVKMISTTYAKIIK